MGFCMLIYLAGLQNIPKMYEDTALLDGASKRQIFFKVDIPPLMPAITTAVITNPIGGLKLLRYYCYVDEWWTKSEVIVIIVLYFIALLQ